MYLTPAPDAEDLVTEHDGRTPVVVLGGGLVGGFIARQLALDDELGVTLVDNDKAALKRCDGLRLSTNQADLRDKHIVAKAIEDAALVIGAVPGWLGYQTLSTVIDCGKDCVDISFFPENPSELQAAAVARQVQVVYDCGVMPGLGGMLAHYLAAQLDSAQELRILVGGLPVERVLPLEYKAPFSPADVIEEYTRPARLMRGGELRSLPALSEVELLNFPGVGTLEAFNTDGLRSLLDTLPLPEMAEKTLRYPGNAEKLSLLRELGFFSDQAVVAGNVPVRPRQLTSELLFQAWQLKPGDQELTAMRVEVAGLEGGSRCVKRCDMLSHTDPATGEFSMARTTGWPAIITARLLLGGVLKPLFGKLAMPKGGNGTGRPAGLIAPDWLGSDPEVFHRMLGQLAEAGIELSFSTV